MKRLPPIDALNTAQSNVLATVAEGGKIKARRTYPFEHRFKLVSSEGKEYASLVPPAAVSILVENRYVTPVQLDDAGDSIDYHISRRGAKAVKERGKLPANPQLALIDEPSSTEAVA